MLGDALATKAFDAFKQVQAYVEANGPFGSPMTSGQNDFLLSMVVIFKDAHADTINTQGKNGLVQQRFDKAQVELKDQADTLTGMVGGIVDVDMAEAVTQLEAAQLAVQAAAQVFASLQSSSLLNVLK